ncbi:hypothetical protein I8H89_02735 [Candidatus Saccharibacteria bacterium]|nr:hypothetical protein [Candidatus Saccharibacteria bacterium]
MSDTPTREQRPFYNHFERLLSDDNFTRDIELLRNSDVNILEPTYENIQEFEDGDIGADEIPSPLFQVMEKYSLPLVMEDFMYHYVSHGEVALDKLRNGVYILDHDTMKASGVGGDEVHNYQAGYVNDSVHNKYVEVTLAIPVQATNTQIIDTIKQHKQFIKDRQTLANSGQPIQRVKSFPEKALRNKEIMRMHKEGLEPAEIAEALFDSLDKPLIGSDVSKIIYKEKQKTKRYRS